MGARARIVVGVALIATGMSTAAHADPPIPGFTPGHSAEQQQAEQSFQRAISANDIGRFSRTVSKRPQLIGSPGNREAFKHSLKTLRGYGLRVKSASYDVYISRPEKIQVTMTKPFRREARVKEPRFPWQRYYDEVVVGYNAYSPKGDVTGDLVYANYGLPADYEALEELGVDVRGKIVIVRYGESFRGVKAKVAEDHGAKGLIIYSDPEDDGYVKGPVFPNGPWKDANGIQRGSIEYIFDYPGDPLTPGAPSTPATPRLDPADATNLPKIPTTPLSYGEAEPMLKALTGPEAPEDFQGGLQFKYHVGPGPTETRLNLDIAYEQERVNDVVVEIRGAKHPEQKVVLGGHFDGWTYGTDDNTSAWSSIVQAGRGFGRLLKRGWRPDRTIVLVGWDGEEYGLLGSTEWVEELRPDLRRDAIAYINMDGVGGREFSAGGQRRADGRSPRQRLRLHGVPGPRGRALARGGVLDARRRVPHVLRRHPDDGALPGPRLPGPPGGLANERDDCHAARRRRRAAVPLLGVRSGGRRLRARAAGPGWRRHRRPPAACRPGAGLEGRSGRTRAAGGRAARLGRALHPARQAAARGDQPLTHATGACADPVRGAGGTALVQAHDLCPRRADRLRRAVPACDRGRDHRRGRGHRQPIPRPGARVAPARHGSGEPASLGPGVGMLKGFKDFVTRGNLIEVAVGLIMALALFALVQALIADLITPIIAAIVGEPDFGGLSFTINGSEFLYGDFINALITFVSVAAAVYFFVVLPYQKYKEARGIGTGTKPCPECTTDIPEDARRCPHCTAQLQATPAT
jgi:large conductance mechanosensitive channel protein